MLTIFFNFEDAVGFWFLKMMLDFDNFEDDAGCFGDCWKFDNFEDDAGTLAILKMMLEF